MTTDSADTRHLDVGDLIAEVTGQPLAGQARAHFAGCAHCQLEANRWNLVAGGIRAAVADAPGAPQPARPRHTRRHVLPRPLRHAMMAAGSVAAALVLLLAIGSAVGVVHVHFSGGGTDATLTSVTGCTRLEQGYGTLERVNGSSVIIKAGSGHLVTVTTTAATRIAASGALLGAITDGATVTVAGTASDGRIAADLVLVGDKTPIDLPGSVAVQGTVSEAGTGDFTVVTSAGTRVPVTASHGTDVVVTHASLGQLQVGGSTIVVGYAAANGTLSALGVVQPPDWPRGAHVHARVSSCSPASMSHELLALARG